MDSPDLPKGVAARWSPNVLVHPRALVTAEPECAQRLCGLEFGGSVHFSATRSVETLRDLIMRVDPHVLVADTTAIPRVRRLLELPSPPRAPIVVLCDLDDNPAVPRWASDQNVVLLCPEIGDERLAAILTGIAHHDRRRGDPGWRRVLVAARRDAGRRIVRALAECPGQIYAPLLVDRIEPVRKWIGSGAFDAVLLDTELEDGAGWEGLPPGRDGGLPVIGTVSTDCFDSIGEIVRAGCNDLIRIDGVLDSKQLGARIERAILAAKDLVIRSVADSRSHELLESLQRELIMDARIDRLTGVPNRAVFDDLMRSMHKLSASSGVSYTLALGDIDNFKGINDEFGHAEGDRVLRLVASTLGTELREGDFVARCGGEEFGLLLAEVDCGSSYAVVDRLRESIASLESTHDLPTPITMSFGLVEIGTGVLHPPENVFKAADAALYRAKSNGRNRVECATMISDENASGSHAAA